MNTSRSTLGQETSGRANVATGHTRPQQAPSIAVTSKAGGKRPPGLNPSMQTPYVTAATNTSRRTLASITFGKWNVRVRILWIELSLRLTPIRRRIGELRNYFGN